MPAYLSAAESKEGMCAERSASAEHSGGPCLSPFRIGILGNVFDCVEKVWP